MTDIDAWGLSLYGSLSLSPKAGSSPNACAPDAVVYKPSELFTSGDNFNVTTCGSRIYYWNSTHLYALGANWGGTLGTNNFSYTDTRCLGAVEITTISDDNEELAGVACSATTSMAWTRSGRVYGWGVNNFLQINATSDASFPFPTPITMPFANVVKVSVGKEHSLALSRDGEVACWGRNRWNQCNSGAAYVFPPAKTFLGVNASDVATGSIHSLVLTTNGSVYSAGFNQYGQCCQTSIGYRAETPTTYSNPPHLIVGDAFYGRPIHKIAATIDGSFFLTDQGRLFGCGKNTAMGFGYVPEFLVDRPREIFALPTDDRGSNNAINSIFASSNAYHTLFSTSDLRLVGVGVNTAGELGLNTSVLMSTRSIISLPVTSDITNSPVVSAHVSGYQSVVETDSTLTRPAATILAPQCQIQGCTCPAPLADAICVNGAWTGPNLVIYTNVTIDVNFTIVGNLTLAPGGSLSLPFGSVLQVPGGCAGFYGGFINYTVTPTQLLQVYTTAVLIANTSCGTGSPLIHLNVNGTVDPCNNVTVSGFEQRTGGLYVLFSRSDSCKKPLKLWIIGAVVGAVVAASILFLLLAFLVKPVRLFVFPFYKRQLNDQETQALRSTASDPTATTTTTN